MQPLLGGIIATLLVGQATAHAQPIYRAEDSTGWHLITGTGYALTAAPLAYIGPFEASASGTPTVAIMAQDGYEGLLAADGRIVLPPTYDAVEFCRYPQAGQGPFVRIQAGEQWGLANARTGQVVWEPQFDYVESVGGGAFAYNIGGHLTWKNYRDDMLGGRWGLLDTLGVWKSEAQFAELKPLIRELNPRLFAARTPEGREGLINRKAEWVLQPVYDEVRSHLSCHAWLLVQDTLGRLAYGWANASGQVVQSPQFKMVSCGASDAADLIIVQHFTDDNPLEFTTLEGEPLPVGRFSLDGYAPFEGGLTQIHRDYQWAVIDTNGRFIKPFANGKWRRFPPDTAWYTGAPGASAWAGQSGTDPTWTIFETNEGKLGVWNYYEQRWVVRPAFEGIYTSFATDRVFAGRQGGELKLYTRAGEPLALPALDDYRGLTPNTAGVLQDGAWHVYHFAPDGTPTRIARDLSRAYGLRDTFVIVSADQQLGLIDSSGRQRLPEVFVSIESDPFYPGLLAQHADSSIIWYALDTLPDGRLKPYFDTPFDSAFKQEGQLSYALNGGVLLWRGGELLFFQGPTHPPKVLKPYRSLTPVATGEASDQPDLRSDLRPKYQYVALRPDGLYDLLGSQLHVLQPALDQTPVYDETYGNWVAAQRDRFGILGPNGRWLTPPRYQAIETCFRW